MAILTISNVEVAEALLRSAYALPQFQGSSIQIQRNNRPPDEAVIKWLQSTPYEGPGPLRRLQERRDQLGNIINFHTIAFGWVDRDGTFSIEWETGNLGQSATLRFNAINSTVDILFTDMREGNEWLLGSLEQELPPTRCQVSSPFAQLETLRRSMHHTLRSPSKSPQLLVNSLVPSGQWERTLDYPNANQDSFPQLC